MKRCAIVGAGISGLTVAYWLNKLSSSLNIDVYDAQPEAGGLLRTEIIDDCIVDSGPDSFLTQKQAAWDLIDELNLRNEVIGSNDSLRSTFIFYEGRLHRLPDGFFLMVPVKSAAFLKTKLLSWNGKLDVVSDLFALRESGDVSVGEFIERRFGPEILEKIAEPLLAGIYGADVHRLSLRSALPQIWELQKKGSLILQLGKKAPAGQHQTLFTSFRGGMEIFTRELQARCEGVHWKFQTNVGEIVKENGRWKLQSELYDMVVLSSSRFPRIESEHGGRIGSLLDSIRRNSAIVIALGFKEIHPEGFGWLVPAQERRSVLACTYVSNKFKGRTPPDRFLIRLFIGGDVADQWIHRPDSEIYNEASSELRRIAGIAAEPVFSRIYRWQHAMPEYAVGHQEKMETIGKLTRLESGLFIAGNLMNGVGIPDCIAHARKTADEVMDYHEDAKTLSNTNL